MLNVKNRLNSCNGFIVLKSSDKFAINNLVLEIHNLLNNFSNCSKKNSACNVIETKKNKYITIFRSSFVHKKSKETFLLSKYSTRIQFTITNPIILTTLLNKLENYNKNVDSLIKFKSVDLNFDLKNIGSIDSNFILSDSSSTIKFADSVFKNYININNI
jgi:ribosomal protein S10